MSSSRTVTATFNLANQSPFFTIIPIPGPTSLIVGELGTWTASVSDPDGNLSALGVNWGDGTNSSSSLAGATSTATVSFSKSYGTAGTKTITFAVWDTAGASASTTQTVNVTQATNSAPVISSLSGPSRLRVGVTGTWTLGATDADGNLASLLVLWGDGTYSSSSLSGASATTTVSHRYASVGTRTITFTVSDTLGVSVSATLSVEVWRSRKSLPAVSVRLLDSLQAQLNEIVRQLQPLFE
jgi:uncharacterized protein YfaS (alpha-2-macroglobulin family)